MGKKLKNSAEYFFKVMLIVILLSVWRHFLTVLTGDILAVDILAVEVL